MDRTVIIIGGGHAGFQLANSLRREGHQGRIVIFERQDHFPYQRPPLSKSFLSEQMDPQRLLFRPPDFYSSNDIDIIFADVHAIDRQQKQVIYDDNKTLCYAKLVFATGVSPVNLNEFWNNYHNVFTLSNLLSAVTLREKLVTAENIIVVGSGFIGLEFASVARLQGKNVHVIANSNRVMRRSLSSPLAAVVKAQHIANGVKFHDCDGVADWTAKDSNITSVALRSGQTLPVDLIIVGIGSRPNVALAAEAGLPTADGIIVDSNLRTKDPAIYAIGDCCRFPCQEAGSIRLESVQNAVDQARYLSRHLVQQNADNYHALAWFWSDQGEMRLQIAGVNPDTQRELETVLPDDDTEAGYVCYRFLEGQLVVVETLNRPSVHMLARKVLSGNRAPTRKELAGVNFNLHDWSRSL